MSRRRTRHDRNALLWTGACFLVLQLGLAVAIEWRLPRLQDPEYAVKAQRLHARALALAGPQRPFTVVMLGSSRTHHAFDAGRLEKPLAAALGRPVVVFNFGIMGAGPINHLINLNRLLAEGVRPDLLLIEVLPPLLGERARTRELERLPAQRLGYRDLAVVDRYPGVFPNYRADWWQACAVPWYAHRFVILSQALPRWLPYYHQEGGQPVDDSGWAGGSGRTSVTPAEQRDVLRMARADWGQLLQGFRLGGCSARALADLLDVCRREGIASALVLMPEGSEFRGFYTGDAWAQIDGYVGQLSRRHGVPLINARTWLADDAFWDSHHLLLGGAAAFTDRFGREGIEPLARALLRDPSRPGGGHDVHARAGRSESTAAPATE
jgi:hypothetical protein